MQVQSETEMAIYSGPMTNLVIVRNCDLGQRIGSSNHGDLIDKTMDAEIQMRIPDSRSVSSCKTKIAETLNISEDLLRFWLCESGGFPRLVCSPRRILNHAEENQRIDKFERKRLMGQFPKVILYVETDFLYLEGTRQLHTKTDGHILIFIKRYFIDPTTKVKDPAIRFAGSLIVELSSTPGDFLHALKTMAGLESYEEIEIFEELTFNPVVVVDQVRVESTFADNQLVDGSIICIQKAGEDPDVSDYLRYLSSCCELQRTSKQIKMLEDKAEELKITLVLCKERETRAMKKASEAEQNVKKCKSSITLLQLKMNSVAAELKKTIESISVIEAEVSLYKKKKRKVGGVCLLCKANTL